jgi:hypothetical protein
MDGSNYRREENENEKRKRKQKRKQNKARDTKEDEKRKAKKTKTTMMLSGTLNAAKISGSNTVWHVRHMRLL